MAAIKTLKEIQAEIQKLREAIERKHKKTPEQLYEEREKRILDAVQLKVPDRVPVIFGGTFFACKYAGLPYSAAYYDATAWKDAYKKMMIDLEPDAYGSAIGDSGRALEAIETNYIRWPGGPLPENVAFQIIEHEYMKEDEYDLFLADPSDYIVRVWLPRVYGIMQPLTKLPPLMSIGPYNLSVLTTLFATPEFAKLAIAMKKSGQEELKWRRALGDFSSEMTSLGFPRDIPAWGGVQPPFSGFTNSFRTWTGVAKDMFRRPEKLKAALEKMLEYNIARATPAVRQAGRPTIGTSGEPHRVSDEFMSPRQFETFVWPYWKRAIEKTFELGYDIISMFFEGRRDKQLEYINEFPDKRFMIRFAETDIFKAKEVLGKHTCIMGNVPITLLQIGSPSEVEDYCKKLIKVCGKDGGFILRCTTDYTQEARPENVKAMIDSAKKYGRY
jgi:uroporphyrinogen-III decarboxylase